MQVWVVTRLEKGAERVRPVGVAADEMAARSIAQRDADKVCPSTRLRWEHRVGHSDHTTFRYYYLLRREPLVGHRQPVPAPASVRALTAAAGVLGFGLGLLVVGAVVAILALTGCASAPAASEDVVVPAPANGVCADTAQLYRTGGAR